MENIDTWVWNALGLALVGIAGYMIVSRLVIPRFASPWMSKRRRQEAFEKAESLLDSGDLDDETRYRVQRCLATLRSYDAQRESWSQRVPIVDIVEEIESLWEERRIAQS